MKSLRESYAPPLVALLRELGAHTVRHSGRTFLDHLVGTARLLEAWGAADDVCKAGLFHSIYGTEVFRTAVLPWSERPRVVTYLGARAERLSWLFCAFERRSLYAAIAGGAPYQVKLLGEAGAEPITEQELADLVLLVWSNALEQLPPPERLGADARARSLRAVDVCRPWLPAVASAQLVAAYGGSAISEIAVG